LAFVDQGLASVTNFSAIFVAAVFLSAEDFGYYSIAYTLYLFLLGIVQSFVCQSLVLEDDPRQAVRPAVAKAFAVAVAGALLLLGIGLFVVPRPHDATFIVLGLALPALLVQEVLRTAAMSIHAPVIAIFSDGVWLLGFVFAVAAGHAATGAPGRLDAWQIMTAWSAAGVLALLVAVVLTMRHGIHARRAASRGNNLGRRFVVEYLLTRGTNQLSLALIGVLAGVAATGSLRGSITLFGPVSVVISAIPVVLVPTLKSLGAAKRSLALAGLSMGLVVIVLGLTTVLVLIPPALGEQLLGDTWSEARALMLPVGCQFAAIGVGTVGFTALRMTDPRRTLPIKLVGSAIFLLAFWSGYWWGGITLAAWGLFAGSAIQGTLAWGTYLRRRNIDS
jgi:O-antigen/teichoic acid export membrane protein